jgi:hypothetical protein
MPTDINHTHRPVIVTADVEEAMPPTTVMSTLPPYDDKGHTDHFEEKMGDDEEEDMNSPENILKRYPLLRDKSEKELDTLNRRLRRRLWVACGFRSGRSSWTVTRVCCPSSRSAS